MASKYKSNQKLGGNPSGDPIYKSSLLHPDGRTVQVVDPNATRALVALMDMHAVLGGAASHYGGPAAFAELMSALHGLMFDMSKSQNKQWHELFHFVNDAGHCENGLYALKANYQMAGLKISDLRKFRSIESALTGHGEAHCFPEGVLISNGPLGSGLPQAQGLALGDALHKNFNRVTVTAISDGACMEGEAKESFAAIPGFAKAGKMAPFVMVISDNNTKLTGRIDQDSFSMAPTFESLKALGWEVIVLEQGNNLKKCFDGIYVAVMKALKNPKVPVVVLAKTLKGIGHKKSSDSASGGHGFSLKSATELKAMIAEIYQGQTAPEEFNKWSDELVEIEAKIKAQAKPDTGIKVQVGVSNALIKAVRKGHPVISISSDLPGSTGLAAFRKEYPQFSMDVGIAESNMVSTAIGLSKLGFIPVVDTFAQFGVTKGALPLTMASLSQAPMIAIFSHTGFQDAADGASHQALSYLAMSSSIPGVETYCLSCSDEADYLISQAVQEFMDAKLSGAPLKSYIFFLGRENFPTNYGVLSFQLRKANILADTSGKFSKSVTLITTGSLVPQLVTAIQVLAENGIGAVIVHHPCANVIDLETVRTALLKTDGNLISVEDHQMIGGFGQMLGHQLLMAGVQVKMSSLAVKGEFGRSAYSAQELYDANDIGSNAIVENAKRQVGH